MKFLSAVFSLALVWQTLGCTHTPSTGQKLFEQSERTELYGHLARIIVARNAAHLKECNCMKALYRDLLNESDNSSRYVFDQKVQESALAVGGDQKTIRILAIGSGKLLNELTAIASVIALGKNAEIFLFDNAYLFYGDPEYKKNLISMRKPKNRPPGFRSFGLFQEFKDDTEQEYLEFFEEMYAAIDEFKLVIADLDKIYHTTSTVTVLAPPQTESVKLPGVDIAIAIDAFMDWAQLLRNFVYRISLPDGQKVRILTLNKITPLGDFFDVDDLKERDEVAKNPVTIEVGETTIQNTEYCYQVLEKISFTPSSEQLKKAPSFITNPKTNTNQSPLDINKP